MKAFIILIFFLCSMLYSQVAIQFQGHYMCFEKYNVLGLCTYDGEEGDIGVLKSNEMITSPESGSYRTKVVKVKWIKDEGINYQYVYFDAGIFWVLSIYNKTNVMVNVHSWMDEMESGIKETYIVRIQK